MSGPALEAIRDLIQQDVGGRGLRTDPEANLVTACPGDFAAACRSLAETPHAGVAVVTGFFIPQGQPPACETDGPPGALFLARALVPLGVRVALATDAVCKQALRVGLAACGLEGTVPVHPLPSPNRPGETFTRPDWQKWLEGPFPLTHLAALERVGPSHTPTSVQSQPGFSPEVMHRFLAEVPPGHFGRCHSLRGRDLTPFTSPAHLLFEAARKSRPPLTTIGIGDGGNEIGMGKVPWDVIRRNIPGGGLVACRVATDYLIVSGVSNWGAYGLAAGVYLLRGRKPDPELFNVERERDLLRLLVERGPLVDGLTGRPTVSVDGLPFDRYAEPLRRLGEMF